MKKNEINELMDILGFSNSARDLMIGLLLTVGLLMACALGEAVQRLIQNV